jgi:hypothetical protein
VDRPNGGVVGRMLEAFEERSGTIVVPRERLEELVEAERNLGYTYRELEDLGWRVMDYFNAQPGEVSAPTRRKMVQKARVLWENDPQAFAAVNLMNDFTFGRGVSSPRCKDAEVQELVDEAWNDPDNARVLTSYRAQLMRGTDLSIQANVFFKLFDDSADGRVKLALLEHDDVETAVRDPENNLRVLYYLTKQRKVEWDFKQHAPKMNAEAVAQAKTTYYEAWGSLEEAQAEREQAPDGSMLPLEQPDDSLVGRGKIYHVSVNLHGAKVFGSPDMQRSIRWLTAYNDFMKARVDVMKAVAAFVYQRRFKGGPAQLQKQAAKLISRESPLSSATDAQSGPRPASIVDLNEAAQWEPMRLDTGSGSAQADGRMIGAQVSAVHRFPRGYFGDADASNLAGATSLELPVLKAVESRQEVWEDCLRWFVDRVIEKAVDDGRLTREIDSPEEIEAALVKRGWRWFELEEGEEPQMRPALKMDGEWVPDPDDLRSWRRGSRKVLVEAHEDKDDDEEAVERNLGYELKMPSPLRRAMPELVGAIQNIARTFDPNNENVELSRILLQVAFADALEMQDAADLVAQVFPEGYESGAGAAAVPGAGEADVTGMFGQGAAPTATSPPGESPTPITSRTGRTPEQADRDRYGQGAISASAEQEDDPNPALRLVEPVAGGGIEDMDDLTRNRVATSSAEVEAMYDHDVLAVAVQALSKATLEEG